MRQGFFAAAVFAAGLLALSPSQAANKSAHSTTPASSGPRIAVLDVQAVLTGCQRGREALAAYQQKVADLDAQAKDMNEKRKAYKDQLDKADAKSADYPKLLKQYQDEDAQLNSFVTDSRQLLQARQQELFGPIDQEMQPVVAQYFKDNHLDILLGKTNGSMMVSDAYNATQGVIDAMDKDWITLQKSQPAAPAATTPAPAATTKH